MEVTNVVIGIQARSTSQRFPKKVFEMIGEKTMLQHVIDACRESASYINHNSHRTKLMAKVALLIPFNDEIKEKYRTKVHLIEGPEDDVLSRYVNCQNQLRADYIVRVTSDCPLIPRFLISKVIHAAVLNQYDYCSNVDERFRTHADGYDCEAISAKALEWLNQNAKGEDREHVTTLIRRFPPRDMKYGHIIGYINQSHQKLSVDTPEDLQRVRENYEKVSKAILECESLYGKGSIHRF